MQPSQSADRGHFEHGFFFMIPSLLLKRFKTPLCVAFFTITVYPTIRDLTGMRATYLMVFFRQELTATPFALSYFITPRIGAARLMGDIAVDT
jgi:hypothetical protein